MHILYRLSKEFCLDNWHSLLLKYTQTHRPYFSTEKQTLKLSAGHPLIHGRRVVSDTKIDVRLPDGAGEESGQLLVKAGFSFSSMV